MNTKNLIAIAALLAAGSAFAQEGTPNDWIAQATHTADRAEVHAQAVDAARGNRLSSGNTALAPLNGFVSTLTRTQVAAEARQAVRLGVTQGEGQRFYTAAQLSAIRSAGQQAVSSTHASAL